MTEEQRNVLKNYLEDQSADIDQIHFLSGGNVSKEELTIVTETTEGVKRMRNIDVFAGDGSTVSTRSFEVRV